MSQRRLAGGVCSRGRGTLPGVGVGRRPRGPRPFRKRSSTSSGRRNGIAVARARRTATRGLYRSASAIDLAAAPAKFVVHVSAVPALHPVRRTAGRVAMSGPPGGTSTTGGSRPRTSLPYLKAGPNLLGGHGLEFRPLQAGGPGHRPHRASSSRPTATRDRRPHRQDVGVRRSKKASSRGRTGACLALRSIGTYIVVGPGGAARRRPLRLGLGEAAGDVRGAGSGRWKPAVTNGPETPAASGKGRAGRSRPKGAGWCRTSFRHRPTRRPRRGPWSARRATFPPRRSRRTARDWFPRAKQGLVPPRPQGAARGLPRAPLLGRPRSAGCASATRRRGEVTASPRATATRSKASACSACPTWCCPTAGRTGSSSRCGGGPGGSWRSRTKRADEPLRLEGLSAFAAGYRLRGEEAASIAGDPSLARIWDVGLADGPPLRSRDYMDCPYYEQLQYAGDTRIQALISYVVGGDDAWRVRPSMPTTSRAAPTASPRAAIPPTRRSTSRPSRCSGWAWSTTTGAIARRSRLREAAAGRTRSVLDYYLAHQRDDGSWADPLVDLPRLVGRLRLGRSPRGRQRRIGRHHSPDGERPSGSGGPRAGLGRCHPGGGLPEARAARRGRRAHARLGPRKGPRRRHQGEGSLQPAGQHPGGPRRCDPRRPALGVLDKVLAEPMLTSADGPRRATGPSYQGPGPSAIRPLLLRFYLAAPWKPPATAGSVPRAARALAGVCSRSLVCCPPGRSPGPFRPLRLPRLGSAHPNYDLSDPRGLAYKPGSPGVKTV
jgi:hypothetical protein